MSDDWRDDWRDVKRSMTSNTYSTPDNPEASECDDD